ncbi:hypothetical protein PPS11_38969 [Pseudomonas putida S11]|nr:hypothetical protein PPS11_38969 [Pseudomonas putida S11]
MLQAQSTADLAARRIRSDSSLGAQGTGKRQATNHQGQVGQCLVGVLGAVDHGGCHQLDVLGQNRAEGLWQALHLAQRIGQRAGMHFGITVLARQIESTGQRPPPGTIEAGVDLREQGAALAQQLAERFEHQLVLAVEVGVETTDGQACRTHDLADAGLGRAVLDQRTSRRLENALAGSALLVAHQATRRSKYDDQNIIRIIFFGKQNLQPPVGREILSRGEKQKAHSIIE